MSGIQQPGLPMDRPFLSLTDPPHWPSDRGRPVIAIGNFDGVHLGHQAVFKAAMQMGAELGQPAVALTFEPHPRSHFAPDKPVFRLTPPTMKQLLAERLGLDGLITLSFNSVLAGTSAATFVDDLLIRRFAISGLAVGYDFSFGKGRSGSAAFLKDAASRLGFPAAIVPQNMLDGAPVSSSEIRRALENGDVVRANALLGYPYTILGEVLHGRKLGRTIGYPTANIALGADTRLRMGIYAVRMRLEGETLDGVASFGTRPTFDNGPPLLEVFLFDFSGDLYGRMVEVQFVQWLRPELKFDGVEPLVAQMNSDSAEARRIFRSRRAVPLRGQP
jgi:riboflavin kinase / FMN adenylyltransferase